MADRAAVVRRAVARGVPDGAVFRGLVYLWVLVLLLSVVVPYLYLVSAALRPTSELFLADQVLWVPETVTVEQFARAFEELSRYLKNSFLVAVGTAALTLVFAIPAAYVFGRKEFPGKRLLFYGVVVSFLFPKLLLVVPVADLWYGVGLYNTLPGLWLADAIHILPWTLWILRDYFAELPPDLEEAAMVYGCSEIAAIYRVVVPLSMPAVVAVGFLAFLAGWNEFLFAHVLTTGNGPRPAVVHLFVTVVSTEGIDWSLLIAEAIVVGLPPTVLYLFARRYLAEAFAMS